MKQFPINLRTVMAYRDITIEMLSKKSGISQAQISNLKNGKNNPNMTTLSKLASGLEVQVLDLCREDIINLVGGNHVR